ncbi:electron transfer flavoprotein subunit beta/FixA family protein [Halobellus captivus]|uniref:electron transfer flavoprotein subunit beta/FixA family protein n=1 Tax=Halobellus captivus TaxID=2592614 RepID=UPI00119FBA42|nr:electron transfer flavoprotein subunit beta/FixA family protein [Halobellus captivus]
MKILVTVKEVAEVYDDFEISGLEVAESSLNYTLNEWDNYAIEEAVSFAESNDDVEVVVVSIGPQRCEETIRMALAKGADRAIRVWDDRLTEQSLVSPNVKATILAAVAREEDPDIVLTGVQASDDGFGATGVALAEELGYEWAAVVNALDIGSDSSVASVHRELEGGIEEFVDIELPAVFTIQTGINEPRYASMRGIRRAQGQPLNVKDLTDLGLSESDLDSSIHLLSMNEPESESEVRFLEGTPEETATELSGVLQELGVKE